MNLEQPPAAPTPQPTPAEAFGFHAREILFDRVSDERFQVLLADAGTTVHRVEVTANSYGEFCFCTLSRPGQDRRIFVSFYSLGYHEHRERWLTGEWFWFVSQPWPELAEEVLPKADAQKRIQARRQAIAGFAAEVTQSRRGQLFELLADLGDDDGAITAMEELPWWLFDDDV